MREFGNEQFGRGVGPSFSKAMFAMDDYWFSEVRRFDFDSGNLPDAELRTVRSSLARASAALAELQGAERLVTRNRLYYRGFTELAEVMVLTSRASIAREEADRLVEKGQREAALPRAEQALADSKRVVEIISSSNRYGILVKYAWWNWWTIGRRPERMAELVADIKSSSRWKRVSLADPGFELKSWTASGAGRLSYSSDAHSGTVAARVAVPSEWTWVTLQPKEPIKVKPGNSYRVEFWARAVAGNPRLYLDWFGSQDGENCEVAFNHDRKWHRYSLDVPIPAIKDSEDMALRFVFYALKHEALVDDVKVWELAR
jgi:hypothetical protein